MHAKKIFLLFFLFAFLLSFSQNIPPKVIYLNTRPAPQAVKIPFTAAEAKGKKLILYYGQDTIKQAREIPLAPVETKTLPVLTNSKGEPVKPRYALVHDAATGKVIDSIPPFPPASGKGNVFILGEAGGSSTMQTYTTDNGLALDAISYGHKSAICDSRGNLWFGTAGGGVSRFDGKSFTNFSTVHGLASNSVLSITEDRSGNLWFGTNGGGASRYDGKSFVSFSSAQGLAGNSVLSITEDRQGNLWFGTDGGGVSKYDGKSFVNFTTAQGLASNIVYSIAEDKTGNLWMGTSGSGVSRFNGKSFASFSTAQGLASNGVLSITEDKTGNLWFGTDGGGVSRFDGKLFINFTTAQGLANNTVLSITEDKTGNIWFGTDGGGVSKYDGKSFVNFTKAQGLPNNSVFSIMEDKTGNLWFGTYGGGVSRYDGKSFVNFTTTEGLANNSVLSITEDKTGNLWFGSYSGGVSRFDGKAFVNFNKTQGLANNTVFCITEDKTGNIWMGTSGGGVSKYDGKSFVNFTTSQGLPSNIIISVKEDKSGNLWLGTDGGGVSKYDGKSFVNFTTAQGLSNNRVFCITQDNTGNLWFGTVGGGVSRYDGKSFVNYTTAQGLANNIVYCIAEDKTGDLWFGTFGGISKLSAVRKNQSVNGGNEPFFENYKKEDGLPDEGITQILEAENGKLYIGTNLGICELILSPGGRAKVGRLFNTSTGYPVKDVNTGQNAMYKDSRGIIWIATGSDKTGLVHFDPSALRQNNEPPEVFLQTVKINDETICFYHLLNETDSATKTQQEIMTYGKPLAEKQRNELKKKFSNIIFDGITKWYPLPENLVLPYNRNHISFEWNTVETGRHLLVRYQYMLEGYDADWSPVTEKDDAGFGNIQEGTYTFRLKARSPEGIWSEPIAYTFKVLPPWYRTWWMYTIYGCTAVLLVWLIVWLNSLRLIAQKKNLQLQVADATQTIREEKEKVERANMLISEKNKDITDSISYAARIQRALLASKKLLDENLKGKFAKDYFMLYKPKDIVSGDFYWATFEHGRFYIACCDSTGHGVPGAFMSLLNSSFLNEAIINNNLIRPSEIFDHARARLIENVSSDGAQDGMDGILISMQFSADSKAGENQVLISYAAANNAPVIIQNSIKVLENDRMPIGTSPSDKIPFRHFTIQPESGKEKPDTLLYLYTDGFADQFGGPKGKKFKYKQLNELLLSINNKSLTEQKNILDETFEQWKGSFDQVDDVLVIGIKL